jgi:hypothetical protein
MQFKGSIEACCNMHHVIHIGHVHGTVDKY